MVKLYCVLRDHSLRRVCQKVCLRFEKEASVGLKKERESA